MILKKLGVGPLGTNCYIIGCPETLEGAVIDPGGDGELIKQEIDGANLQIKYIINTHGHGDHIGSNREIKDATQAPLLIHEADAEFLTDAKKNMTGYFGESLVGPKADDFLREGDVLNIGSTIKLEVIHTPGHTPGCICLDTGEHLFTGDTLFAGSIGRTDLVGGSYEDLISSVRNKIFTLTGERQVWPGHGPGSTLSYEKQTNPFFRN